MDDLNAYFGLWKFNSDEINSQHDLKHRREGMFVYTCANMVFACAYICKAWGGSGRAGEGTSARLAHSPSHSHVN